MRLLDRFGRRAPLLSAAVPVCCLLRTVIASRGHPLPATNCPDSPNTFFFASFDLATPPPLTDTLVRGAPLVRRFLTRPLTSRVITLYVPAMSLTSPILTQWVLPGGLPLFFFRVAGDVVLVVIDIASILDATPIRRRPRHCA